MSSMGSQTCRGASGPAPGGLPRFLTCCVSSGQHLALWAQSLEAGGLQSSMWARQAAPTLANPPGRPHWLPSSPGGPAAVPSPVTWWPCLCIWLLPHPPLQPFHLWQPQHLGPHRCQLGRLLPGRYLRGSALCSVPWTGPEGGRAGHLSPPISRAGAWAETQPGWLRAALRAPPGDPLPWSTLLSLLLPRPWLVLLITGSFFIECLPTAPLV